MSQISIGRLAVPAVTEGQLLVQMVDQKTGHVTFDFTSVLESALLLGAPQNSSVLNFNIYESDDRISWGTALNSSPIVVNPGGNAQATVISRKKFLKITGYGSTAGGYARVDMVYNGLPYFGQLDLDVSSVKSGFAGGAGAAEFGSSVWPN